MRPQKRNERTPLGWREWITLPDWDVAHLKAKIDTGARTSSLHAFGLEWFDRDGNPWVRFEIHPLQRSTADAVVAEASVVATRDVKSSSGEIEHRPVVATTMIIAGRPVPAEITLTRRDEMGFRMLVGREALRKRFVIDPAVSYLGGRPDKAVRRRNRADTHIAGETTDTNSVEPTTASTANSARAAGTTAATRAQRTSRTPDTATRKTAAAKKAT